MKKAVLIIAPTNFRDEELLVPAKVLQQNNVSVEIASTALTEAVGMLGARITPTMRFADIKIENFDAIVFIGGSGAS
ncbi:MAG: DJ-1/PfpI family protein, partial [Candidatus Omnitrophica bacterium]|nr:DJ-1/PfpI family protein [Candidatus Omnitrophota bacterium]